MRVLASLIVLGLSTAAAGAQPTQGMSAADCRAVFNQVDTNRDGVLSQQELRAANAEDPAPGTRLSAFVAKCAG